MADLSKLLYTSPLLMDFESLEKAELVDDIQRYNVHPHAVFWVTPEIETDDYVTAVLTVLDKLSDSFNELGEDGIILSYMHQTVEDLSTELSTHLYDDKKYNFIDRLISWTQEENDMTFITTVNVAIDNVKKTLMVEVVIAFGLQFTTALEKEAANARRQLSIANGQIFHSTRETKLTH